MFQRLAHVQCEVGYPKYAENMNIFSILCEGHTQETLQCKAKMK